MVLIVGAAAAVLAFSTTDRDSFDAIEKWRSKVRWASQRIFQQCFERLGLICMHKVVESS